MRIITIRILTNLATRQKSADFILVLENHFDSCTVLIRMFLDFAGLKIIMILFNFSKIFLVLKVPVEFQPISPISPPDRSLLEAAEPIQGSFFWKSEN